jgi:hypothetical protein
MPGRNQFALLEVPQAERGEEELSYVANEASFQAEAKGFVGIRLERCRVILGSNHYRIASGCAFAGHGTGSGIFG